MRCKGKVRGSWSSVQCSREAVRDGYCAQHHPDAVAARQKKRTDALDEKMRKRLAIREAEIAEAKASRRAAKVERAAIAWGEWIDTQCGLMPAGDVKTMLWAIKVGRGPDGKDV
jgi:hypothetical protein